MVDAGASAEQRRSARGRLARSWELVHDPDDVFRFHQSLLSDARAAS